MATISLITAAYNSARTIADTITSINVQTYPDIEHIIVDGASKDDTMERVKSLGKRVAKAISEPDKGIYDAYNKGLNLAGGDIIGFLNSDDFYCSDTVIEEVMTAFRDPEVDAVHADLVYVDPENTSKIIRHWKSRPCTLQSIRRGFMPAHPTLFLRRSVYDLAGQFDTSYRLAADYEFMLRALYVHKICSVYLPKIWVRMRTGGATGGTAGSIMRQNDEILTAQRAHGLEYPRAKFFAHKLVDRSVQHLRGALVQLPAG